MYNTMTSVSRHIANNFSTFGLDSADDLKLMGKLKEPLPNGAKWLVLHSIKTVPNNTVDNPFASLLVTGQRVERFLTLVQLELRTRAPDPTANFPWDTVRQFRDNVYNALLGPEQNGLAIPRHDWTDPESPILAGEIWFEVKPANSPLEESWEDPNDPANKSIFLTYNVHWWRPTVSQETGESDPWIEALALWAESELGEGWTVIRNTYPEVFERPAVIWNLVNISARQVNGSLFEVSKKISGKVLGSLPNQEIAGCLAIMEGLGRGIKIPLDTTGSKYLTVVNPQVDIKLDSMMEGQITVNLTRKTGRLNEEIPLMMKIEIEGSWQ